MARVKQVHEKAQTFTEKILSGIYNHDVWLQSLTAMFQEALIYHRPLKYSFMLISSNSQLNLIPIQNVIKWE